ncbi:hypothetical protein JOC85_000694 [Bacillus mesophilus]|uniref:DUF1878 family protein n=1 Tax=Bacillus mesophilus TaxID=1808955 RepID=A0A6M0Q365_9BACI|nr:DUF1878 family protein [Bacillus mesophilus]MBM7659927.1 hypothetical protein [Bacillus mesophilus]NEY70786.1 DUF1878 family protein [Bacillus mesophilus]
METIEKRIERLEYYQKLMLELVDLESWPLHHLVMKRKLSEEEVEELFYLCEELTVEYKNQKAEGFVGFTPLLQDFIGRLNEKLSPLETIEALHKEQLYQPLMLILKHTIIEQHSKSS